VSGGRDRRWWRFHCRARPRCLPFAPCCCCCCIVRAVVLTLILFPVVVWWCCCADKDPRARPDTKTILSLPAVAARLPAMPDDDESSWAGEDMRSALLATIRVPHMFGYGGKPALALPVRHSLSAARHRRARRRACLPETSR